MQPKELFIENLESMVEKNPNVKILDLGSGQSRNYIPLLQKYPELKYIGVEPNPSEANIAQELIKSFPNAKIYNQPAYDKVDGQDDFDICISLSVLEHVKYLEKFLINSVASVKKDGLIIHRYDLGHALHSGSCKEKLQIFLGNNLPWFLPESKFVNYVDENWVKKILTANGAEIKKITYHQMPDHKSLVKYLLMDTPEKKILAREMWEWEYKVSEYLTQMEQKQRELLFPTISIQAIKL